MVKENTYEKKGLHNIRILLVNMHIENIMLVGAEKPRSPMYEQWSGKKKEKKKDISLIDW